ncbi:inactive rhomboid protein 2-like isoform X2 [Amphibalanus amphitrite]|uniref:inactive rhomboid protein 2-like isoform X2 n=1 Tax=Amphibalanus amphitrite TaxID=1232801 RepID=UPI001C8FAADA|nr:inactive rhomboid protein 2-like isoform X2 [Amphibalanus amphitrite]
MSSVSDASGGTPGSGVDDVTPSRASHVTSADSRRESQASRSDGTDHELIENPMYEMEGPGKRKSAESPSSVRVSPKDERLTSEPRDRPEVKRWHSVPVGHVVRTDQQPTRARPPLQPQLSRVDRVKSYMKRGTKQFFGLDDECDDENQCRWLDRRRRLAAKAYGRLKDDSDHPQMSLPAGYGADVTDSMGGTLHRRRHKDNVGKMTLQGLGYVATLIRQRFSGEVQPAPTPNESRNNLVARGRLARGSQQRTSSRSYPPSATVEGQSAEETAFDERDGPTAGHGGGFKAQSRWAAAAAAVTVAGGRRQAAPELAADEVFFDNVPSADGAGDVQDPLQTSRDGAQWQRPPADRDVTDAGPGVGNKRIWSQMLDRVFDNSNRRQYGRGLAGRLFGGRSVRRSVTARSDVVAQMDDLEDHRPYFTYWVTTVQLLVMLISLACYGFGPIGFELQQQSGTVMDISLSVQQVDYWEPPNLWLGPRAADLIHLGAKFAPCMRRDEKIQKEIFRERRKERDTACCIRNDNSGCVQSAQADCSRTISTFKSWLRSGGHEGRVSGPVCGLDPHYCAEPGSRAPYEWPDDITKWPICRKTSVAPEGSEAAEHMLCEVVGHPCCVGIHGLCQITTREYCNFVRGYFHEEAALCSQVSCLDDVCGMIPFYDPDSPDQFYRLWTSIFLHAGIIHLVFTILIQFFFLRDLEKMAGALRIAIIYIVSGIAGNLASAIFVPYRAEVGPAGSQFGLLACHFVEVINVWPMLQRPWRALLRLLGLTFVLFLIGLLPWVDNYAHIFGFIVGFLLSYALLPYVSFGPYDRARKKVLIAVCVTTVTLLILFLLVLFYVTPFYECKVCEYLNCLPLTRDFCAEQNINFDRRTEL